METVPKKLKRTKNATREELLALSKEELADRIIQLETHNFNLKNVISKKGSEDCMTVKKNKQKVFDFSKSHFRRVLIRILYFGWDYQGFVVQEDTAQTIEHHLFDALTKSCLVESREKSCYHRCGRTDKGVSAYGQVISILIRSKYSTEIQDTPESIANEFSYCKILNRLLPKDIRAVAWMPICQDKPEFSARFDCKQRQYKYYFPRGTLSIQTMKEACKLLIGDHDFRNLCKMDVGNGVTKFMRTILNADVLPVDDDVDSPTSMYYLQIEGNAFLWHQIRCIMAVLLLIGSGKETKDVITSLLDVGTYEKKPQYHMAIDIPLNLFNSSYEIDSTWVYDTVELGKVISHLQNMWSLQNIKATMLKDCLKDLELKYQEAKKTTEDGDGARSERDIIAYTDCLTTGTKPRVYTPLLKRHTCSSLEERIEHYRKRRKIPDSDENMDCTHNDSDQ